MASGNSIGVDLSDSAIFVIEALTSIFGVAGVPGGPFVLAVDDDTIRAGTMMVTVYCTDAEFVAAWSRRATVPEQFTVTLTSTVTEQAEQAKFALALFVNDVLRPALRSDLT
jgi:hypothetical protein